MEGRSHRKSCSHASWGMLKRTMQSKAAWAAAWLAIWQQTDAGAYGEWVSRSTRKGLQIAYRNENLVLWRRVKEREAVDSWPHKNDVTEMRAIQIVDCAMCWWLLLLSRKEMIYIIRALREDPREAKLDDGGWIPVVVTSTQKLHIE